MALRSFEEWRTKSRCRRLRELAPDFVPKCLHFTILLPLAIALVGKSDLAASVDLRAIGGSAGSLLPVPPLRPLLGRLEDLPLRTEKASFDLRS